MSSKTLGLVCSPDDRSFLPHFKALVGTAKVFVRMDAISTLFEMEKWAKERNITGIFLNQKHLLKKLIGSDERKDPSLDNYQGSLITRNDIEYVILNPLDHLVKVNYAKFTFKRFISKLTHPEKWNKTPEFSFLLYTPANAEDALEKLSHSLLIGVDIETRPDLSIECISYTGVIPTDTGELYTFSYVIPLDDMVAVTWMRRFNDLPPPKVTQNGKYDNSYLLRYNAPLYNWLCDTANAFHSWLSELPKDLGFLGAFFIRNAMYWKDLAKTGNKFDYYLYNAKDSWSTVLAFVAWLQEKPDWSFRNYVDEFPLNFPCLLAEMTGIKRDEKRRSEEESRLESEIDSATTKLQKCVGKPINTNSPKQVTTLLKILGCSADSSDEKTLKKFALQHPLNEFLLNQILEIRKLRKLLSTYIIGGKEFNGRILYALNPHATDTSRLASKEHHFWCGLQIQNIPRGKRVKSTLVSDDGFYFGECDLEQAESRDTGYIAGDEALITAVSGTRDFHSVNASAFFGIAYDELYDDTAKRTKNKKLRDLAKRVNHGANYNMGAAVLVDTMGIDKIREAQKLLGLPRNWGVLAVASFLLERFEKTYPQLKGQYYKSIVHEINITNRITSRAYHWKWDGEKYVEGANWKEQIELGGWTRYCFGKPDTNKRDLNAYVAHSPQSLNAQTLNRGYMRVFYDIAMHPEHSKNFRLLAQIHDSILFLWREGHEYLCDMVKERMEIPITIKSVDGVYRRFTVPAAIKIGTPDKRPKYWSETEE